MSNNGALVEDVVKESIAADVGIAKGDRLLTINGMSVKDYIDYQYLIADEYLEVAIKKSNGEEWLIEIEKDYDDNLGIIFTDGAFGKIRQCANQCVFCFVDQMPQGMRKPLYVKDDDYRHSFMQGNFITLTNLTPKDIDRIKKMHLSPLYISVHTTNPDLRVKMQGNQNAAQIMQIIQDLHYAGIEIHAQVVLCPGINDGQELHRTIKDLYSLSPTVKSLAVVPVGLTKYRENLYPLRVFTPDEAAEVTAIVHNYQEKYQQQIGYHFVYAADEFYLLSGKPLPISEKYDDYPQTENGVGLARIFLDSFWAEVDQLPNELAKERNVTVVTGASGAKVLTELVAKLNQINKLRVKLAVIRNNFFGETVTVSGLVTGQDIYAQLTGTEIGDLLVIPSVMLKKEEQIFLDNMKLTDLAHKLSVNVQVADTALGARDFINIVVRGE